MISLLKSVWCRSNSRLRTRQAHAIKNTKNKILVCYQTYCSWSLYFEEPLPEFRTWMISYLPASIKRRRAMHSVHAVQPAQSGFWLCLAVTHCHTARTRNQNWPFVKLYCSQPIALRQRARYILTVSVVFLFLGIKKHGTLLDDVSC